MSKTDELENTVQRCIAGERRAHDELFRMIRTDVFKIVVRTVGSDSEIDDIVQSAFLEIFRSLPGFKGKSKFSTWMYRLVVNVSLQHLRKRKKTPSPVDMNDMANYLIDSSSNPEKDSRIQEDVAIVRQILNEMKPKKRHVFLLHEVEQRTPGEIAEMLDISVFTVKSRLFYARKEFFKKLRQNAVIDA